MQETQVQSLGQEDPLEKEMATHSSILAQRIPWTEEPGVGYSPWGCKESGMTEATNTFAFSKHKTIAIGGCQRLKWEMQGLEGMIIKDIDYKAAFWSDRTLLQPDYDAGYMDRYMS